MSAAKPWWQSVGIAGGVASLAVGVAQIYSAYSGDEIDLEGLRNIVEDGVQALLGVAGMAAGIISIYGRLKAFKPIKKPRLPWQKETQTQPKE